MKQTFLFIKYAIGGAIATLLELMMMYFLTDKLGVWYLYSSIIAYSFGFIVSFSIRKLWAFADYNFKNVGRQFLIYIAVLGFGMLLINTIVLVLMVEWLQLQYLLAQFLAGLVIGLIGFFINKKVTFKE